MATYDGVSFGLLGPLEVFLDGKPADLDRRRNRLVLAALLLSHPRPIAISRLTRLAWLDQEPPPTARNGIQATVSRLRATLAGHAGITTIADGYRVDTDAPTIDLHRFRTLVARASHASAEEAVSLLRQAEAMWRGEVLAGTFDDRLRQLLTQGLSSERIQAIGQRIDRELQLGRHGTLVGELVELRRRHPTNERFLEQLTLALYRDGRSQEALETVRHAREATAAEFGTDLNPSVRNLEVAILQHAAHLQPPRATTALPARRPAPAQLPLAARGFTGRAHELARLDAVMEEFESDRAAATVVISGMAGVGKTALALRWASSRADAYPDGQMFYDLRGNSDNAEVATATVLTSILHALGTPNDQIPPTPADASALLRTVARDLRLLIVLDNVRSADQVRPLMPGNRHSLVLVTSRYRLGELQVRDGASSLALEVLPATEAVELLRRLVGDDQAGHDPDALNDIARLCAYLPLALRIAAARLVEQPGRGIAWYRDELAGEDRLDVLTFQGDEGVALRGMFDMSYRSLPNQAQRVFCQLGAMPGTEYRPHSVAALTNLPPRQAKLELDRLVGVHLLCQFPDTYRFHDLIRDFAADLAASDPERGQAIRRLYDWYVSSVDAAAQCLMPSHVRPPATPVTTTAPLAFDAGEPQQALAWLDQEYEALAAAIKSGLRNGQPWATTRLANGMRGYLQGHAGFGDWLALAQSSLAAAERTGDLMMKAAAHIDLASAHGTRNGYEKAAEHLVVARALCDQSGWTAGALVARTNLAIVYGITGYAAKAYHSLKQLVDLTASAHLARERTVAQTNLAVALCQLDRPAEALKVLTTQDRSRLHGLYLGEALDCEGTAHHQLGHLQRARDAFAAALECIRSVADAAAEANTLAHLSAAVRDLGELGEARKLVDEALARSANCGSARVRAEVHNNAAALDLNNHDAAAALHHAQQAHALARSVGARRHEIVALIHLAGAHRALSNIHEEAASRSAGLHLAKKHGYQGLARIVIDSSL